MSGYSPVYVPRSSYYTGHHDADIVDSLNKAEILSNAALDDSYEASVKSKSRDYTLLRNANAAIMQVEEPLRKPRSAVISRRSVRASTAPPAGRPARVVKQVPAVTKPKRSETKSHRDVDGVARPTNIMSWEHKLDARVNPNDIIYQPESYNRLRQNLMNVQDKMHRQRQLLDRYLLPVNMSTSGTPRNSSKAGSVNIPFYYYAGGDPYNMTVSPLRRKLRRTICKAKGNPDYYRMMLD